MLTDIKSSHERCFVCGQTNSRGLQANFSRINGLTTSTYRIDSDLESLPGITHGGILISLMDAAMAQHLLDRGIIAVTAMLDTKFRRPVPPGSEVTVTARERPDKPLSQHGYHLEAKIVDEHERIVANAKAIFVKYNENKGIDNE